MTRRLSLRSDDATRHPQEARGASMATDAGAELRVDVHNIEPIPEADKDSTGLQQMWIWAGANIAPINWALGALGIVRADSRPWPQSAGGAKQSCFAPREWPPPE